MAQAFQLGRFAKSERERASKAITDFYDVKIEATQAERTIKTLIDYGQIEAAKRLLEKNKAPVAVRKSYDKVGRKLSEINKAIKMISMNPDMSPQEKDAKLTKLHRARRELTKRANQLGKKYGLTGW